MFVSKWNTRSGVRQASWIFILSAALSFMAMGAAFASGVTAPAQPIGADGELVQDVANAASAPSQQAERPTFVINPESAPLSPEIAKLKSYNMNTKHYYLLKSYLESFEKTDGGTLILQGGVYNIPRALFVTSNTTIIFEDGAEIVKTSYTGTGAVKPTKSVFQLIRPSRAFEKAVYRGYEGEHDITFKGTGRAGIDLSFYEGGMAIVACHNKNVTIEGIMFENNNAGHFIEMDANLNAIVRYNSFMGSVASANENKEAINLDTPDKSTNGFNSAWSSHDMTANRDVLIQSNYFYDLDRAIGTHKYSGGQYHTNVRVVDNVIRNTRRDAIRVMNWKDAVIERNTISNAGTNGSSSVRGILASGAVNPTIRDNLFINMNRIIQFMPWKNDGPGSQYPTTYNVITSWNKVEIRSNKLVNVKENFIRINNIEGVYDKHVEKVDMSM
jgi:hypothetical protein